MSQLDSADSLRSPDRQNGHRMMGRTLKNVLALSLANEMFIPRKQISVALGMDVWSIAHGSRLFNRIRILDFITYRTQEPGYPSPETVASAASLYCVQEKLTNPRVTLCIPKAWAVVQTTELPDAVKENLPGVVACELDRITPFGPDDAYYDYRILKESAGRLHMVITASKRRIIDPYISALAEKGLTVTQVDTGLAAVATYLSYTRQEENLIYLDIGPHAYECGLLESGVIVSGRADVLDGGGTDESLVARVAESITPWIEMMDERNGVPQLMVHAHNGIPCAPLEERLRIPLQPLNDEGLTLPRLRGKPLGGDLPRDAVGGVLSSLWTKSKAMNLLSLGSVTKPRPPLALTVLLVAALLLMGMLILYLPLYLEHQKVAAIDQEIAARKDAIRTYEALRNEYSGLLDESGAIAGFKRGKQQTLQILKELTVLLPRSVWLTRVHLSDTKVSIEGYATSATDILPRIEASPFFSRVEFASPTIRDVRMNMDRFVIRMELEGIKTVEPKGKNGKKP